jgi:hypothetical protein
MAPVHPGQIARVEVDHRRILWVVCARTREGGPDPAQPRLAGDAWVASLDRGRAKKKGRAASCEAVVEPWEDNGPANLWIYQTEAPALLRVAHDAVK